MSDRNGHSTFINRTLHPNQLDVSFSSLNEAGQCPGTNNILQIWTP
jgi:hypothetical protein